MNCQWLGLVTFVALVVGLTGMPAGGVNVSDFGAKGDGTTDDTAAIQTAIGKVGGISAPYPGAAYYNEMQELYFPPGQYRISSSLKIGGGRFRGDGAVIEQMDPAQDIFVTDQAWRMSFSGFTFLGGRSQIVLHNPNLDTGQVHIEKCLFYGAKGVALDVDMQSTTLTIRDCIFLACRQVLINKSCDQAIMTSCWITTDIGMRNLAAIEHRAGRLTIEDLCGVPLVNGADQRWIDNYGSNLTCRSVRFGGEGGGFTPVVNYAKYDPTWGPTILLDDCLVCANGNAQRNCAVFCVEVPNQIDIRDCMLGGATLVELREGLDLKRYFQAPSPRVFSFLATGNTGVNVRPLPAGLTHPKVSPPPPKGLTRKQTRDALARAVAAVKGVAGEDAAGGEFRGHRQQSAPGTYVDLAPPRVTWQLDDLMDATAERNSEHLALQPVGTDVVVLRRTAAEGNWPHVTIHVRLDLDRYPFLTWKQKDVGSQAPGTYAVRVLDEESGKELLLEENYYPPWDGYRAFNLRELLKLGGERRLRLRYYYLGIKSVEKRSVVAQPGDFIVLDFLRAEKE
jgi:hypothetical protein